MWRPVRNSYLLQLCHERRYTLITVVSLAVILLAFFISFAAFAGTDDVPPTLKLVHVIFRHGDKTPSDSYPTDPHKEHEWLEGKGALTNKGKTRMFKAGTKLRERYGEFLGDFYSPDVISMESSYAPRCQMSAQVLLAALFPPKGSQIWNENLLWQPIPVDPIPRFLDNKIASKRDCPAYEDMKRRADKDLHQKLPMKEKEVFEYLSEHTGLNITTINQVDTIYYVLRTQKENGLTLPEWTERVFPNRLAIITAQNLASFTRHDDMIKFKAGPMVKDWLKHISEAKEQPKKKAYLYSGHDLTIVTLARALGFVNLDIPFYGDMLLVEYHESSDGGFIQVFYYTNNDLYPRLDHMKLEFCDQQCSLKDFEEYMKKFTTWTNWDEECKKL